MPIKVLIPTPLRKFTDNADTLSLDGENVGALLSALVAAYPGLGKPLLDDAGKPRKFVNLYLNGEDVRFLQNTESPLKDGDEISIVPAIAGGASGTEVYQLTFTGAMLDRPIISSLGKRFRVTVNLRRAILSEENGWAEVALSGPAEEIGRAIADLHTTGVNVTGPLSETVEESALNYTPVTVGRGT